MPCHLNAVLPQVSVHALACSLVIRKAALAADLVRPLIFKILETNLADELCQFCMMRTLDTKLIIMFFTFSIPSASL